MSQRITPMKMNPVEGKGSELGVGASANQVDLEEYDASHFMDDCGEGFIAWEALPVMKDHLRERIHQ